MDEEIIILEEETEIIEEIEIEEGAGVVSSSARHNTLVDRNDADSHEISAIRGLRAELDKIETPRVIESNMRQQADYYKWQDENPKGEDRAGLFVSLYTYIPNEETGVRCGTGNIQICDGTTDVFGVTVEGAGFVGNQEYIKLENSTKIGRDGKYNLVAHSGVVAVQKNTDVAVGDYVIPSADGKAKKVEYGKYGYLVTGVTEMYGVGCAIISLSAPSMTAKHLSDTLYGETDASYEYAEGLVTRMKKAEGNISNLTTSLQEFKTPDGDQLATKEDLDKVYDKVDGIDKVVNGAAENAQNAATQAGLAAQDAANIRSEAVAKANEAITAIEQIGESVKTLTYDIAEYSIGEYSQIYGLTYEQAKKALEIKDRIGCIHIPTVDHEEMYEGYEVVEQAGGVHSDIQRFSRRCYYTWDGKQWISSDVGGVVFDHKEYFIGETTPYWVVEADVTAEDGNIYHKGEIWYWNDGKPILATTVDQNGFSRAVNYIHKAINETNIEVTNAKGDMAGIQAKLDSEGAKVAMVASVVENINGQPEETKYSTIKELKENVTKPIDGAYYCVGDAPPYKVYKVQNGDFVELVSIYYDGINFCAVNVASIVASVNNDGDSSLKFNANKIDFTANDYTINADKIDFTAGEYTINANKILFETDDYKAIADNIVLDADDIKLDGYVTFDNLKEADGTTIINGGNIQTDSLSSISANLGVIEAGVIQSKDYKEMLVWDIQDTPNYSTGLEYSINQDGTGYIVNGIGTCTDTNIIIPTSYDGLPVCEIIGYAFKDNNINSIIIPNSVTSIGGYAFSGCNSLTSIEIPDSVISIGEGAFHDCSALTYIKIPNNVRNIEDTVFSGCSSLTSIKIPNNVTSIGYRAFYHCDSLTSITIPDSVISMGNQAFLGCTSLTSIEIFGSITSIGKWVFYNCDSLTSIVIPDSVIEILDSAFLGCMSLTSIYYKGDTQQWNSITIDANNTELTNATIYYYSETEPTDNGNYWHYKDGFKIACEGNIIESKYFNVSSDGKITANEANISGTITASDGQIGAWQIDKEGRMYSLNTKEGDISGAQYGMIFDPRADILTSDTDYRIFAIGQFNEGIDGSYKDAKFHVYSSGKLVADGAEITGHINANSGEIGDLIISDGGLRSDDYSFMITSDDGIYMAKGKEISLGNFITIGYKGDNTSTPFGEIKTNEMPLYIKGKNTYLLLDEAQSNVGYATNYSVYAKAQYVHVLGAITGCAITLTITNHINYNIGISKDVKFIIKGKQFNRDTFGYSNEQIVTLSDGMETKTIEMVFGTALDDAIEKIEITAPDITSHKITLTLGYIDVVYDETIDDFVTLTAAVDNNNIKCKGNFIPVDNNLYTLGGPSNGYWKEIYCSNSIINTSDKNKKQNIELLSSKYSLLFDKLEPVSFKFKENDSNRTHVGLIAQQVKESIENADLTTQEFAGYCEWENNNGEIECGLRYGEFIALCIDQIQKLKKRVEELENKL